MPRPADVSREEKYESIHQSGKHIYDVVIARGNGFDVGGEKFGATINDRIVTAFTNDSNPRTLFNYEFMSKIVSIPPSSTATLSFVKDSMLEIVELMLSLKENNDVLTPESDDVIQKIKQTHIEILKHLKNENGMVLFGRSPYCHFISRGVKGKPNEDMLYVFTAEGNPVLVATYDLQSGGFIPEQKYNDITFGGALNILQAALLTVGELNKTVQEDDSELTTKALHELNKKIRKELKGRNESATFEYGGGWYFISRGSGNQSSDTLIVCTRHKERLEVVFTSNCNDKILDVMSDHRDITLSVAIEIFKAAYNALTCNPLVDILNQAGMFPSNKTIADYLVEFNTKLEEVTKQHFVRDCMEITREGSLIAKVSVYPDSWCITKPNAPGEKTVTHFVANRYDGSYQRSIHSDVLEVTEKDIRNVLKTLIENIERLKDPATMITFNLDDFSVGYRRELDKEFVQFTTRFTKKYITTEKFAICVESVGTLWFNPRESNQFNLRLTGSHVDVGFIQRSDGTVTMHEDKANPSQKALDERTMEALKQFL